MNYYNDNDPFCAAWLRELIKVGLLPAGDVDDRSIADVKGTDLKEYAQCHFFAGIGGWPYALKLAGWPATRHVWTGSCPCQPLSGAGKRKGERDARHLWPEFARLIRECAPAVCFGEQVASADGREWLSGIRGDLEAMGYAVGAADLCVASIGAPHIRQRLYWVADSTGKQDISANTGGFYPEFGSSCGMGNTSSNRSAPRLSRQDERKEGHSGEFNDSGGQSYWSDSILIPCGDGKSRRVKPGVRLLAHGLPARVGRLRGYGNAIVPQVAAEFVRAFMETERE